MTAPKTRWFTREMAGAPSSDNLTLNQDGSLIAILDACLITGFGILPITTLSISGGIGTATIDAGHGYLVDQVINLSGCVPVENNGDYVVKTKTINTFTFETTQPDQVVGGAPLAKVAPLGWTKPYVSGDGLRAAYRNDIIDGTGMYMYVEDNHGQIEYSYFNAYAMIWGAESMTDIDTRTNEYPSEAIRTGNTNLCWMPKERAFNSGNLGWAIVGDHRGLFLQLKAGNDTHMTHFFGDFMYPGVHTAFGSMCMTGLVNYIHYNNRASNQYAYCPRDMLGFYNPQRVLLGGGISSGGKSGSNENQWPYPDPYNNGVVAVYPLHIVSYTETGLPLKGYFPGFVHIGNDLYNNNNPPFDNREVIQFDDYGSVIILEQGGGSGYFGVLLSNWRDD